MSDVDSYQVAEEAVRLLDPEEVVDLPEIWQSYLRDPVTPAGLAERDGLLGSGLGSSLMEWAPLVVAYLGTEVFAGAAIDSAKDGLRRGTGKLWRKLRKSQLDKVTFDRQHIEVIREQAVAAAAATGRTPEEADQFAEAMVAALQHRADA